MISRSSKALVAVALAALAGGTAWADRGGGGHYGHGHGHSHARGRVDIRIGAPVIGVHRHWGGYGHHPHYGARVFLGPGPFYDPFWSPYRWPGYYAPPVVAVPVSPPTYIERAPAPAAPQEYWYWCSDPQGYYPTVQQCPGGWQPVQPQ